MKKYRLMICLLLLASSCSNDKPSKNKIKSGEDKKTIFELFGAEDYKSESADIEPIWGHRFQVSGDFNADGVQDTLKEHFYSHRDHKETNKYFSGIDDALILYDSVDARVCQSFLLCSNPKLDTVPIGGVLGPLWLRNEGDLDGDGGDELSFVESYPQQSSMNECVIASFKNGKWKILYRFEIREWQFPPLPQAGKTYGLFGGESQYTIDVSDSVNLQLQKQLDDFPGLITKLKDGKIEVQTFNSEMIDTTLVVDLSKPIIHYK